MIDDFEKQIRTELLIDADYRKAIETLQIVFDKCAESHGMTNVEFAREMGVNPSYASRIINGRQENVTFKTLAKALRALGHRISITAVAISDIPDPRKNDMPHPELTFGQSLYWITGENKPSRCVAYASPQKQKETFVRKPSFEVRDIINA